jgi:hypothetical protein
MAYTHAYMLKKNLLDIEHMARRTNDRLSTTDRVMPWESDLISQADAQIRSVYRYRKYKDRFGHTHRPKTPFLSTVGSGGNYGGCGTFFGLTKDPVKRACYVEKKIAKHAPKCSTGKQKSCTKVQKYESELAAITGNAGVVSGSPADFYYQQAVAYEQQVAGGVKKGPNLLPIAAIGVSGLLLMYALVQ